MLPDGYGWLKYKADQDLIVGFENLQGSHSGNQAAPLGLDARVLLGKKQNRVRTGPGHITSGRGASFSPVASHYEVPDSQAYAVLIKEVDGARARTQEFRQMYANVSKDSPLEEITCAIHIAEVDNNGKKARDLTYLLGQRLLGMPHSEQLLAKRRTVGDELYQRAIGAVQPALL